MSTRALYPLGRERANSWRVRIDVKGMVLRRSSSGPKYAQLKEGESSCDPRRNRETRREVPSVENVTWNSIDNMTLNGQIFASGLEAIITKEDPEIFGMIVKDFSLSILMFEWFTRKAISV
jgi:hypothetical protein